VDKRSYTTVDELHLSQSSYLKGSCDQLNSLGLIISWSGVNWLQVGLQKIGYLPLPTGGRNSALSPSCIVAPLISPASLPLDPSFPSLDSAPPAPKAHKATRRAGKKNRTHKQNRSLNNFSACGDAPTSSAPHMSIVEVAAPSKCAPSAYVSTCPSGVSAAV